MKMRNKISLFLILVVTLSYNACTPGFLAKGQRDDLPSGPVISSDFSGNSNQNKLAVSLQTSQQILASSLSITNIPADSTINNEYNQRTGLFSTNNDPNQVTSAMWIGVTNLNSVICQKLVTKEAALPTDARTFFPAVDFTKPAGQVSASAFLGSAQIFSRNISGRDLASEESIAISAAQSEFISAIATTDTNNTQQTKNLMMFLCTAMLSALEGYTL